MEMGEKTHLKEAKRHNELKVDEDDKFEKPSLTKSEILVLICLGLTEFTSGIYFSMLGPFFPNEARKKGVSHLMIGLIYGIYNISVIITGPILGYNIRKIGPKFMLITGVLVCGVCSILLGCMEKCPPGTPFITLCMMLRIIEGVGTAAFTTAAVSIACVLFPNNIATVTGTLQTLTSLGMMVGPPVGGFLFQAGGFRLPFLSTGVLMVLLGIPPLILLPNTEASQSKINFSSLRQLFSTPSVCIACVVILTVSNGVGYLNIGLSPILINTFHLPISKVGLFFLIGPVINAIFAPILGFVVDKRPKIAIWILVFGTVITATTFFLLEPASNNPNYSIGLGMIATAILTDGISMGFMGTAFATFSEAAVDGNLPDTFETFGLISSIFTSFMSLGFFTGPFFGGATIDAFGFGPASTIGGFVTISITVLVLILTIWSEVKKSKSKQADEKQEERKLQQVLSEAAFS